jgi:hypothetical protein
VGSGQVSAVIPERRKASSPESIFTNRGYGFRVRELRSRSAMTGRWEAVLFVARPKNPASCASENFSMVFASGGASSSMFRMTFPLAWAQLDEVKAVIAAVCCNKSLRRE